MIPSRGLIHYLSSRCLTGAASHRSSSLLPFEAIPGPKPLPLVGNVWRYLPWIGDYNIDELYRNATFNRRKYGPIVREQITEKHVILHLFDPADVELFFRQDGAEPYRRSHRALLKFRNEKPERYNDGGIFPENGASWARLRGMFNKYLMRQPAIELRSRILDDITKQTIITKFHTKCEHGSSPKSPVVILEDLGKFLQDWTLKCALAVFLDYSWASFPEESVQERLLECFDDLLVAIAGTEVKSERWTSKPDKCPYYQKLSKSEAFAYEFVHDRIEHLLKTDSFSGISFVRDWLVRDKINDKDVISFVLDCLLASIHTTAYTTTFLLRNISGHLDEAGSDQLQQEIQHQIPPMTMAIDHDIFTNKAPVLRDCLRETLRLHPVSIGTGRLTQHEMVIRNYHIPKGVMVIAQNQLICRDSSFYENPEQYCPLRWSEYRSQSRSRRPSRFAWLPFGFGPRACLGMRLANLQIQILAARLLQNFDIEFLDEVKTKTLLVHCLDGKIRVRLERKGQ